VLCDTNGGAMPDEVTAAVKAAKKVTSGAAGHPRHNDSEVAVANSLAAVKAGVIQVQVRSTVTANAAATPTLQRHCQSQT